MANFYQAYRRPLQIGEVMDFAAYGKYVCILTWNNAIDLMISIEGQSFFPIKAGMSVRLPDMDKAFYNLRFQNNTGAITVLEFALSDGSIQDNRFNTVGIVNVFVPGFAPAAGFNLVPCLAAAGGTVIVPANPARRSIIIRNLIGNTDTIYIGFDNTLTNAKYVIALAVGEVYTNSDYAGEIRGQAVVNLETVSYGEV